MNPPNLRDVLMPCCCGNCDHNNNSHMVYYEETKCLKYFCDVEDWQVCDSWESINYGN